MKVSTDSIVTVEIWNNEFNLWADGIEVGPKITELKEFQDVFVCIEFDKADGDEFEYLGFDEDDSSSPKKQNS